MKGYFFKAVKPNMVSNKFRLLGRYAAALRQGETPSKADLGRAAKTHGSAVTELCQQLEAYYGVPVQEEPATDRPNSATDLDVPELLRDHALHFSLTDFMIRQVLRNPEYYPDDLVLNIQRHVRQAADSAVAMAQEVDEWLSSDPPFHFAETPKETSGGSAVPSEASEPNHPQPFRIEKPKHTGEPWRRNQMLGRDRGWQARKDTHDQEPEG